MLDIIWGVKMGSVPYCSPMPDSAELAKLAKVNDSSARPEPHVIGGSLCGRVTRGSVAGRHFGRWRPLEPECRPQTSEGLVAAGMLPPNGYGRRQTRTWWIEEGAARVVGGGGAIASAYLTPIFRRCCVDAYHAAGCRLFLHSGSLFRAHNESTLLKHYLRIKAQSLLSL